MKISKKWQFVGLVIAVLGGVFAVMQGESAFADTSCTKYGIGCFGDGGAGQGVSTSCGGFSNGYTNTCGSNGEEGGDGSGGGGKGARALPIDMVLAGQGYQYSGGVLTEDRTGQMVNDAAQLGVGWVIMIGWVRKDGTLTGPMGLEEGLAARAAYNNWNAADLKAAVEALKGGISGPLNLSYSALLGIARLIGGDAAIAQIGKTGYFMLTPQQLKDLYKKLFGTDPDDPDNPGTPPSSFGCQAWAPGAYIASNSMEGTTAVLTKILNGRLSNEYGGWQGDYGIRLARGTGETWARPGDTISWVGCYYPGVQETYYTLGDMDVHTGDGEEGNGTVVPVTMEDVYKDGWKNYFRVNDLSSGMNSLGAPAGQELPNGVNQVLEWNKGYGAKTIDNNDAGSVYELETESSSPTWIRIHHERETWEGPLIHYDSCLNDTPNDDGSYGSYPCNPHHKIYGHTKYWYESEDDPVFSAAKVSIPYNYVNVPHVDIDSIHKGNNGRIFSGDKVTVTEASVSIDMRYNATTQDNYTTIVRNAHAMLIAYVSSGKDSKVSDVAYDVSNNEVCARFFNAEGQCEVLSDKSGEFNAQGSLTGTIESLDGAQTWNAFDAPAGKYMCFVVSMFPWKSGEDGVAGDKQLDPLGINRTIFSAPACGQIAKKPSINIYGGTVFFEGNAWTGTMEKNLLWDEKSRKDIYDYYGDSEGTVVMGRKKMQNKEFRTFFGSWVEEAIIGNGTIKELASGAGFGYGNTNVGIGRLVGTKSLDYCKQLSTLSIANYTSNEDSFGTLLCPFTTSTGSASISSDIAIGATTREDLVDFWAPKTAANDYAGSTITLSDSIGDEVASATGRKIRYVYSSGELTISGGNIGAGTTIIIKALGTVKINGNIIKDSGMIQSAGDIPQVVIYAGTPDGVDNDNIDVDIHCNVGRVDAILIAENNVDTCYNASVNDINDSNRSKDQLKINGMVVSKSMTPRRTYGAATGYHSGTPAEYINYDSSAILWGRYMAGSGESDTLTTVYTQEMAPRY